MQSDFELIFVYNADSSLFALASDFVHKIVVPKSYQCNLCMITYGPLKMKKEWKVFLDSIPHKKKFLHRDEFQKQFPEHKDTRLPVILKQEPGTSVVLVTSSEINTTNTIKGLKELLKSKLKR